MANPTASRASGVAPLSVYFDASTYVPGGMSATNSFHDLEYSWNFDDTGAGSWATSGLSRNEAKGGVAAHVFETPGTYTVALTVIDGSSTDTTQTFVITVHDPAVTYDDALTICYGPVDSEFDGAPADSTQVESLSFNTAIDRLLASAGPRRIMLQRGQTFTFSAKTQAAPIAGEFTIEAFGSGADPIVTCTGQFSIFNRLTDIRIQDITFDGVNKSFQWWHRPGNDTLFLNCGLTGFATPIIATNENVNRCFIAGCAYSNNNTNLFFDSGFGCAFMGNTLAQPVSHSMRTFVSNTVIQHNAFTGVVAGLHQLKFNGFIPAALSGVGGGATRDAWHPTDETEFDVVSDNTFNDTGATTNPVQIGPQNGTRAEVISNLVFERNLLVAGGSSGGTLNLIVLQTQTSSVRNNILNSNGGKLNGRGILVSQEGLEPVPTDNMIQGNTGYHGLAESGYELVDLTADATDTIIKNNLLVASAGSLLTNAGSGTVDSNNVLTADAAYFVTAGTDFHLTTDATNALDGGVAIAVFEDKDGVVRADPPDVGAYELVTVPDPPLPPPRGLNGGLQELNGGLN